MKSTHELREEFASLRAEVAKVLEKAEAENRNLTPSEKTINDARFARMDTIQQTLKADNKAKKLVEFQKADTMEAIAKHIADGTFQRAMDSGKGLVNVDGATFQFPTEPAGKAEYLASKGIFPNSATFSNDPMRPLKHGESAVEYFSQRGVNTSMQVGVGALVRAIVTGPRDQYEQAAVSNGFRAPNTFLLPSYGVASLLDSMRETSAVLQAGASVVPLFDDRNKVAQVAVDPTVTQRAEGVTNAATTNNFVGVQFAPIVLRGVVSVGRETLQDSVAGDKTIEQSIVDSMAIKFDSFALGKIDATSGILEVAVNDGIESYDDVLDGYYQLTSNNSRLSGLVMHPREQTAFAKLKDQQDQPLRRPDLLALVPFYSTTAVATDNGDYGNASNIYAADWPKLIVGCRTDVELQVLSERYAEQHSVGVAYSVRLDAICARPKAFCILSNVTP